MGRAVRRSLTVLAGRLGDRGSGADRTDYFNKIPEELYTVTELNEKLERVCTAFRIPGTLESWHEIKQGNVNRTFKVTFRQPDGTEKSYIVQRVNTYVFEDPEAVMDNIDRVTEYLHKKDPHRKVLHFHHTEDRKNHVFDENGFWRLFNFIPSRTFDHCEDLEIVHNAGAAFGEFQMQLRDFNAADLNETIPYFHNTRKRYQDLEKAVTEDPCGRAAQVGREIEWVMGVKEKACTLTDLYEREELPLRVTHNDTKINNVLFEQEGTKAIVVIDLDTVMPGLVGHDFGDAIRFAANREEEDSRNWENAGMNMEIFREFTEGFLEHTANVLTEKEIDTLAISCFSMTCELATRFLRDYILGDPYFKINYPEHNLVRTQCQIALARDMECRMEEMAETVRRCVSKYRT